MTGVPRLRVVVLARSLLVGLVATGLDLAVLFVLIDALGVASGIANVPALLVGLWVQFVGNKYFAFGDRATSALRQLVPFTAVEAVTFALNAASFQALVGWGGLHFAWARVLGEAVVYVGFSFPCWLRIFARGPAR